MVYRHSVSANGAYSLYLRPAPKRKEKREDHDDRERCRHRPLSGLCNNPGHIQVRNFAVKFSFLVSLPAIFGANILNLAEALSEGVEASLIPTYLVGMLVAAVVGYFSIGLVRLLAQKGKFGKFAYYCWGAGVITIMLSIIF